MRTIVYLSYGCGAHVQETVFSIASAQRFGVDREGAPRFVVYAEHPDDFAGLGVEIVSLDAAILNAWLGPAGYTHRRKTMTMIDALKRFPGSVAFVDSDTYFLRPPRELLDIGPGQSRLHILEARLLESGTATDRALSEIVAQHSFHDLSGRPLEISPDAMMWNSGVLGLHSSDAGLMIEVLNLIDQMWPLVKCGPIDVHHVEQFATGYFLERTSISESHHIVYHYWPESIRAPFRERLPALLSSAANAAPHERAGLLYAARPRADYLPRLKIGVRTGLRRLGLRVAGTRSSA